MGNTRRSTRQAAARSLASVHVRLVIVALALAAGACGKKGPPLAPIVRVPAAVETMAARRVGDDVYVTLRVPRVNLDGSMPASIARVDLYAATSLTPPPRARFLEIATLVGTVPVLPDADPADPAAPVVIADPTAGATQGDDVTIRDTLSDEEMDPRQLTVLPEEQRRLEAEQRRAAARTTPPPARVTALRRFYLAIPSSDRGVPGPPSALVELPLTPLPDPPSDLRATMTAADVTLQWAPAGGLVGWLMDRSLPQEQPPFQAPVRLTAPVPAAAVVSSELPAGPTQYNVYRELAADPLALPQGPGGARAWDAPPPVPVHTAPLSTLMYSEPVQLDERQRCYSVRSVRGAGAQRVESRPSAATCVTPVDLYPPAMPTNVSALVGEGVITLVWDPNGEDDLGGYIVLRREAGSATLLELTATPIAEVRFSDSTVTPGARYTYQVMAVDSRIPLPNRSEPAEVSETAR